MFFGSDDSLKDVKKEMKAAGADMSCVRNWQKTLKKVKKQREKIETQYLQVKQDLETVDSILKEMEQLLISSKTDTERSNLRVKLADYAKKLKKYQNNFNHEFLISKEDSDFHLIYATILSLCGKSIAEQKEVLILQSEVENLLALTKEALEKEWPSFRAMAFYYIGRSDKEIFDLPHQDKVEKVTRIYENEFLRPIRQEMLKCMEESRVNQILEVDVWD